MTCTGPTRARSGCCSSWPATPARGGWRSSAPTGTPTSTRLTRWLVGLAELVRDGLHLSLGGLGRGTWRPWSARPAPPSRRPPDGRAAAPTQRWQPVLPLASCCSCGSDGAGDAAFQAAPASVRAVVSRRLDRLSGATREVLAAAAVLGADVDLSPAERPLVERRPAAVLTALTEAEAARLVIRTPAGVSGSSMRWSARCSTPGWTVAVRAALHQRRGRGAGGPLRRRPAGRGRPSSLRGRRR